MGSSTEDSTPHFAKLRVFAFESRMAAETASLIERFGGRATVVPAMREVPLQDNYAAFEFAARLLSRQIDLAIFLTGVGVRELFRVTDTPVRARSTRQRDGRSDHSRTRAEASDGASRTQSSQQ